MPQKEENKKLVMTFFERWEKSADEVSASLKDFIGDECIWRQSGVQDCKGPEEAIALMRLAREFAGVETIRVDLLNLVAEGDIVISERVDIVKKADGSVISELPVVGVMEIKNGKLCRWSEYFNPSDFKGAEA